MAPEVVKQTAYTKKADIWSVGCLVVEMLTGDHPWGNLTQMQAIFKVSTVGVQFTANAGSWRKRDIQIGASAKPTIPSDISPEAEDFLQKMFIIEYEQRPQASELLEHAFLAKNEV
jgi:mitogen-activated protein kinase kinase kinase